MINIGLDKCVLCGLCEYDCPAHAIKVGSEEVDFYNEKCFMCGHCVAICPQGAIKMIGVKEEEIIEYNKEKFEVDHENLLNFIKFRRSIRKYKTQNVEKEKINNLIEAARYTPTGGNRQPLRYIVIKDKLEEIKELAINGLYDLVINHDDMEPLKSVPKYKERFIQMYDDYKNNQNDTLFFGAPTAIAIIGDISKGSTVQIDAGLAASNMELMANAQGLGICYIGFFVSASKYVPKINEILGINPNEKILATFTLGYPDVNYKRTVNRNEANVEIL